MLTLVPPDWKRPAGRPSHTWLHAIEADLGPLNFGLATAWRKATTWDELRRIVNTAMLQRSTLRRVYTHAFCSRNIAIVSVFSDCLPTICRPVERIYIWDWVDWWLDYVYAAVYEFSAARFILSILVNVNGWPPLWPAHVGLQPWTADRTWYWPAARESTGAKGYF